MGRVWTGRTKEGMNGRCALDFGFSLIVEVRLLMFDAFKIVTSHYFTTLDGLGFTATATSNNYGADCQEVWLVQLPGARPPPTKV